jgi:hypothetical protein
VIADIAVIARHRRDPGFILARIGVDAHTGYNSEM